MKKWPKIKIFVAHHKPWYIYEDDVYVPIQVWKKKAKVDLWILWDDTWDNISEKNSNYAELTAQYWVWKNYDLSDVDYVWFCHYRRYMTYRFKYNPFSFWNNWRKNQTLCEKIKQSIKYIFWISIDRPISQKKIQNSSSSIKNFLTKNDYDICMSKRNPIIPFHNLWLCNEKLWSILYGIIAKEYPDYRETIKNFDGLFLRNGCNIWILKKEVFLEYNEWLFNILFRFEKKIKQQNMIKVCLDEPITAGTRFMWCLWERLFNLFIYHKKIHWAKISYKFNMIVFKNL
jgi:hypothetical protein